MRLIAILLIAAFLHIPGSGKSQTITLSGSKIAMKKVFQVIEQQTDYVISGDRSILTSSKPVYVSAENLPLEQFLDLVFKDQGITYRIRGKNIFLSRKEAVTNPIRTNAAADTAFQPVNIYGTVRSSSGELLAGASVWLEGWHGGGTTDAQGRFTVGLMKMNGILKISSIGYETFELGVRKVADGYTVYAVNKKREGNVKAVAGKTVNVEIMLEKTNSQMDQVIVNGYSNINKNNFTGSAVVIKREELLKVAPNNLLRSLQIFDPSFKVLDNNDQGSDPNNINPVYIRGRSGIGDVTLPDDEAALSPTQLRNDPNLPTFILDGYEVPVQRIFDLDPTRVESITILKDAASTAIYGSRAANGVVVIETVKPVSGRLRVNYSLNGSITAPDLSGYHLLNAREKLELERISGVFEPRQNDLPDQVLRRQQHYYSKLAEINRGVETDWLSQPLRTGYNQRHNLLVEGGSKEFVFGADLNFARTQGVMKGSERNNNSIGFSISYRKNNLMFRNYIQWNNIQSEESPFGSFAMYAEQNPYEVFKDEEGNYKKLLGDWDHPISNSRGNPLYDAHLKSYNRTRHNDFSNNFNLRWTITEGLRLDTRLAVMLQKSQQQDFKDPASSQFDGLEPTKKGTKAILDDELTTWDLNALLVYGKGYGKHYLNTTLGANAAQKDMSRSGYAVIGFPTGNTDDVNFAADILSKPTGDNEKSRLLGFLASANYSYDNIYLLDFSGRYDGASQFGSNVRFAPFWSLGAGINIHNYPGVSENYPWLNNFKVRTNYGQVGKAGFSQSVSKSTYRYNFENWYASGIGAILVTIANPDLEWEKTTMFDAGFDLTVFNKLSLTVNYYHKKTVDLIGDITLPYSTGFRSYKSNLGEILNKGIEVSARYQVLANRNFNLNLYATAGHNSNKFVKISDALKNYNKRVEQYYKDHNVVNKPLNKYYEGASQTSIYAMKSLGINPADGREVYLDQNGQVTYTWNESQHVVVGDSEPELRGAFGFNFSYKSIFVFTGFLYEFGGDMYNSTLVSKVENANVYKNVDRRVFTDRWQKPGDVTLLKDVRSWNEITRVTSRFVQRNNYVDFSSVTIGYDLPKRFLNKWKVNTGRVQVTSNELGRISSIDTERGTDYPYSRTINLTLNLGF